MCLRKEAGMASISTLRGAFLAQRAFMTKRRCVVFIAMCWVATMTLLAPAYGQESRGSITGQIEDATGAVIPGASITAVNVDTRVATSTTRLTPGSFS